MKSVAVWENIFLSQVREIQILPDVNLQTIGDQKLYGVDMATQVKCCISLIIGRQQISSKLVQETADVHIASGGSQVEAGAPPVITDVGVTSCL